MGPYAHAHEMNPRRGVWTHLRNLPCSLCLEQTGRSALACCAGPAIAQVRPVLIVHVATQASRPPVCSPVLPRAYSVVSLSGDWVDERFFLCVADRVLMRIPKAAWRAPLQLLP